MSFHPLKHPGSKVKDSGEGSFSVCVVGLRLISIAQETDAQAGTAERCEIDYSHSTPEAGQ